MYQISRNALEDGTFSDAMTVDVAIDQIYSEPSSPGMIPDTINGNWKLQFTVEKEESLSKSNQISAENNGFTITEFTVQILDKNNAPSDSTIPVVAEIPVSMQ